MISLVLFFFVSVGCVLNIVDLSVDDPREEALVLVNDLVRVRTNYTLQNVLKYSLDKIIQASQVENTGNKNNCGVMNNVLQKMIEKNAALTILGRMVDTISCNKQYLQQMKELIEKYVIPDFDSSYSFLRAGACWTISQFYKIAYKNENTARLIVNGCLKCLVKENEAVVKVSACKALSRIILNSNCTLILIYICSYTV